METNNYLRVLLFTLALSVNSFCDVRGEAPSLFPTKVKRDGIPVGYFGQPPEDGRIILDANNGFFDPGDFVATGDRPVGKSDRGFISKHFAALRVTSDNATARWHLWISHPGNVVLHPLFEGVDEVSEAKWELQLGDQRQSFNSGSQPTIVFSVDGIGKHTLTLRRIDSKQTSNSILTSVNVSGIALKGAKLLRVRWRPSAVHASFRSSTCDQATMWVFESKSMNGASSYSPLTTPFGYFGTSFGGDQPRGFNFSMWAAKATDSQSPPLSVMPHLIATGNPEADFSGFGHEGSGVKIRGWDCLDTSSSSVIQALRIDPNRGKPIYYGYFFDQPRKRWVLYAAGIKPAIGRRTKANFESVGSFCEIPGPPHVQRTGDIARAIARRGWVYGTDKSWHRIDSISTRDQQLSSARSVGVTDDGWLLSHAGGMEILDRHAQADLELSSDDALPVFLQDEIAKQLFELPVEFGTANASDITADSAVINYDIQRLGDDATAILYFGPVDCLTFVARPLHATEKRGASKTFYTDNRTWANQTPSQSAHRGVNRFRLTGLTSGKTYYYRIFVTHRQGKSWAYESGRFETKK